MDTEESRRRIEAKRRAERKKQKRTVQLMRRLFFSAGTLVVILVSAFGIAKIKQYWAREQKMEDVFSKTVTDMPEFEVQLLTPNPYSRPQTAMEEVKGIVIHYTANPGTTAQQNRNYFEGLKDSKTTKVSSHFIVGIDGEVIQCIPSSEIAYASNKRNEDTLSIECCHPDKTGEFTEETYESLVHLTAWLCGKFRLTTEDVIRHYDVSGKKCPLYYVENGESWEQFLQDVEDYIERYGVENE